MGRLGRPEDGRLARLAHIGCLGLPCQQQRVRVGVSSVVDDPAHKGQDAGGEERRVDVPAGQQVGDAAVELLEEAGHGRGAGLCGEWKRDGAARVSSAQQAGGCTVTRGVNGCGAAGSR